MWWHKSIIYNIYPRSFQDSNHDGIGDLQGLISRLDYLADIGIDLVWLNPIMKSPQVDFGYDVSDYLNVDPIFGSNADLFELIEKAKNKKIGIIMDIVPAHTSDQHPWFQSALENKNSPYRDYYVWHDPKSYGSRPNNWIGHFDLPAWTLDPQSGQYYMHNFMPQQPQLNWYNKKVQLEFENILRTWFSWGIKGIRVDVPHGLYFDDQFRDNPPADSWDNDKEIERGQKMLYNKGLPQVHDIFKTWKTIAKKFEPNPLLLAETRFHDAQELAEYYGDGQDEFDLCWNRPWLACKWDAAQLKKSIQQSLQDIPSSSIANWAMSTHDSEGRAFSRWAGENPDIQKQALCMMLLLPGVPTLYYGDEFGLADVQGLVNQDCVSGQESRDKSRTPMPWTDQGGFTQVKPWIEYGSLYRNVQDQLQDSDSVLNFFKSLNIIRSKCDFDNYQSLDLGSNIVAWEFGQIIVILNLGEAVSFDLSGQVLLNNKTYFENSKLYMSANSSVVLASKQTEHI